MTPNSGLSLLLHLLIIAVGKLIDFVKKNRPQTVPVKKKLQTLFKKRFNRVISVTVVTALTFIMLNSLGIAVETGIREGKKEPHWEYARGVGASMTAYTKDPPQTFIGLPAYADSQSKEHCPLAQTCNEQNYLNY